MIPIAASLNTSPLLKDARVLYIDPYEELTYYTKLIMTGSGAVITSTEGAADAFNAVEEAHNQKTPFDIIIMSFALPPQTPSPSFQAAILAAVNAHAFKAGYIPLHHNNAGVGYDTLAALNAAGLLGDTIVASFDQQHAEHSWGNPPLGIPVLNLKQQNWIEKLSAKLQQKRR